MGNCKYIFMRKLFSNVKVKIDNSNHLLCINDSISYPRTNFNHISKQNCFSAF